MYYQISEDEFNSLESARNQLNLIAGLVASFNTKEFLSAITGAELHAFIDAQQATVSRVIEAANEREAQASAARREEAAAAKVPQVFIAPELLMGLMDAAFGKLTESEALNKLWDKLYDAGKQVAAKVIAAKGMRGRRCRKSQRHLLRIGINRPHQRTDERD